MSAATKAVCQKHPGAAYHLSADAAIVQNRNFEKGVVKLQRGNEHELTAGEKIQLRRFLKEDAPAEDGDEEDDDEEEEEGGLAVAQRLHDRNQARKRARIMRTSSKHRSTKHVCSATNMVERLFSRAKLVMTDLRRSMYPRNLEMLMFLRANRHLLMRLWFRELFLETKFESDSDIVNSYNNCN